MEDQIIKQNKTKRFLVPFLLATLISGLFFIIIIPFLKDASGLSYSEKAHIGAVNLWRIVIGFGVLTVITTILSKLTKKFRSTVSCLWAFWVLGTSVVLIGSIYDLKKIPDAEINDTNTIEEELVFVAEEQSKDLPVMLNELTQLTSVKVSGKNLIFSHKIMIDFVVTQAWVDEKIKKNKIAGECNESRWRNLLEKGATIILEYYNKNGEMGGKVNINSSDCI